MRDTSRVAGLSIPPERPEAPAVANCAACGAGIASDQRYCVECGARRGPLPPFVAELIGAVTQERALASEAQGETSGEAHSDVLPMPTPRAAAVAVMALLAFGVLLGSAISPVAPSGAQAPTLLALVRPAVKTAKPATASATPPPAAAEEAPTPAPAPTPATITQTISQSTTTSSQSAAGKGEGPAQQPTGGSELPPVGHVFLIALSDQGYAAAFGPGSTAPYLSKTLPHEGELLENYYAVASGELANGVALISGQGPTPQTAANCSLYSDLAPGTLGADGQVLGSGCVYPRQTLTLADQLSDAGRTWKAYIEGIEAGSPAQPASCRHPALGAVDPANAPTPGDAYVTWRNPFVYFHSIIDNPACAQNDVGLPRLASDLKTPKNTPTFAYIVPDRCHDGSQVPCAPGQPAGLAAAETFLRSVVPKIEASAAYKHGGLIAITFDQAPQSGAGADTSGCCTTTPYPNLPAGPTSTSTTTTTATSVEATQSTIATTPAPTSATSTASTQTSSPPGGGRVGLLLISKYVKPGTLNVSGEYNHFALLRSIENLFGLQPLGYAGVTGLLTFDSSVFNAKP
jgi:hypothetical protein